MTQTEPQDHFTGNRPKDASAVILLNEDLTEVLWAERNPNLKFLGGFHSFPGGKVDPGDALADVRNCADAESARLLACAVREVFEEVGVLLVRNGEKLTRGQRASLHDDLISGRFTFAEILATWGLWIDAADFFYTGFWTTPEFSPVRFKTRFFITLCPPRQVPYAAISELRNIEFITPERAIARWAASRVLIAPPVLIPLRALAENEQRPVKDAPETIAKRLLANSHKRNGHIDHIELNARLICLPLRTATLPPATHTNCFITGKRKFVVIDAAAREPSEQQKLFGLVDEFIAKGFECQAIIVSHLHPDHFGGEIALQAHLREKFGLEVPVAAHRLTAESLQDQLKIDRFITDGEVFKLADETGETFELKAVHTPGHARGHLCFYDQEQGFLLSMDNVLGVGSVLVAPPEGDMTDYLRSLEKMRDLPGLNFLCGSHGPAVADAKGKIEEYIAHRQMREREIIEAVRNGAQTPEEITAAVYQDLDPRLLPLAVKSVRAHLAKLEKEDYFKGEFI